MTERFAARAVRALTALALAFSAQSASARDSSGTGLAVSRNYAEVRAFMSAIAEKHPTTARTFLLGISDGGEPIEGLALGKDPAAQVRNLVVGTHHGNEYGSAEVAKAVAASLAAAPIEGQLVYVVPVLNTTGYDRRRREEYATTGSGRSVDPNRDYPGPCNEPGTTPFKLKSTAALAQLVEREGITASATLHTFYPAVVYPWGLAGLPVSTRYDELYQSLTEAAARESGYPTGNSMEVIYPANGTFEDYAFWKFGVWSLLFELGHSHSPSGGDVERMIQVNVPGIRRMLEMAPRQRAERHDFEGQCDPNLARLDRRDE